MSPEIPHGQLDCLGQHNRQKHFRCFTRGLSSVLGLTIFITTCLLIIGATQASASKSLLEGKAIRISAAASIRSQKVLGEASASRQTDTSASHEASLQQLPTAPWLTPWSFDIREGTVYVTEGELKAAFLYLLHKEQVSMLRSSLILLRENYLGRFPAPVVVFYDPGLTQSELSKTKKLVPEGLQCFFVLVENFFEFPSGYNQSALSQKPRSNREYPSYNHMIRFWWRTVFHHPLVRQLDYFCRLDTDSFILSPIGYDIFRFMELNGKSYGYRALLNDAPEFTEGLFDFLADYRKRFGKTKNFKKNAVWIPKAHDRDSHGPKLFFTNFEVVDVQRFIKDQGIMQFIEEVDATHAIYLKRWGDAPLRYYQVSWYMDLARDVFQFCDFDYFHQFKMHSTC